MTPRYYQLEAINGSANHPGIKRAWQSWRTTLLVLPTGTGKTIVFCLLASDIVAAGGRVLILCHREELIRQAADKLAATTGLACAVEKAEECAAGCLERIIVGSVQTLLTPARRDALPAPTHIICDEAHHCCPAGTLVDGIPIERLRIGMFVRAYDHYQKTTVMRRICRTMSRPTDVICKVILSDGRFFACTPDHPIWNGRNYVDAAILSCNDMVYEDIHCTSNVRHLRNRLHAKIVEQKHDPVLLSKMCSRSIRQTQKENRSYMPGMRKVLCADGTTSLPGKNGENILFACVQSCKTIETVFGTNGQDEPQICVGTYETKQSDVASSRQRENAAISQRASLCSSYGKWSDNCSATGVAFRSHADRYRQQNGTFRFYQDPSDILPGPQTSNLLQTGHWHSNGKTRDRNRRQLSQIEISSNGRCTEDCCLAACRVDRVEIYKRGSDSQFDELCPDGYVYNLEVETDNNFFANGILVHNCLSDSWQAVLGHWPNAKVLGVTATPDRGDMKQLGTFFESLAYEYTLPQAIADGFLCPIRALTLPIKINLTGMRPANGDWSKEQVATALDPYIPELCREFAAHARDRKGLIFVPLCATGRKVVKALSEQGLRAYYCDGEDRSQIKPWEADGLGSVMVNAMLLTEGYDHPPLNALAVWRFTKSRPFYAQMAGRGTRIHPGKDNLLLIDNLFLTEKHQLCRPAHLYCEDDDLADKMTERAERDPGAEMDLTDAEMEKARQEVIADREAALAKKLNEMRHRRRELVDPLQYAMSIGLPDLVDYQPVLASETIPPTQTQIDALAKCKILPTEIKSAGHAEAILKAVTERQTKGLAAPRQIRLLERYGFKGVGQMPAAQAQKLIGRIAVNGWRMPLGMRTV